MLTDLKAVPGQTEKIKNSSRNSMDFLLNFPANGAREPGAGQRMEADLPTLDLSAVRGQT